MKKRILSMLLAIVMVVGLFPVTAGATTAEPVETWNIGLPESGNTPTNAVVAKLYTNATDSTKYDLVISGTGEMDSTHGTSMPWTQSDSQYQEHIVSVTVQSGVINVESYAFMDCTALTSVTLGDTVTEIGYYAFDGCTSLKDVTIPASTTSIASSAFGGCTSLTAYTVDSGNTAYSATDGILFSKDGTTLVSYPSNKSGTSYTVPDSVTKISSSAFCYVTNLTELTIPHTTTTIVGTIFYGKAAVEKITIKGHTGSAAEDYTKVDTDSTTFVSICSDGDDADTLCDVCGYDTAHTAHPVCGATHNNIGDHTGSCEDITWTAWDGTDNDNVALGDQLTAGSYYLTGDVGVYSVTIVGEVNLCLNGHTITTTNSYGAFEVESGAILNICDCSTNQSGKIENTNASTDYPGIRNSGGTVNVYGGTVSGAHTGIININNKGGTIHVYGGTVSGANTGIRNEQNNNLNIYNGTVQVTGSTGYGIYNYGTVTVSGGIVTGASNGIYNYYTGTVAVSGTANITGLTSIYNGGGTVTVSGGTVTATSSSGSGIYNSGTGTLTVSGGTVTANNGSSKGISNSGTLNLLGAPSITGVAADIYLSSGKLITITAALTYAQENAISVKMDSAGTFTTGWTTNMGENAAYGSYFTSADSTYTVQPDGNNELKLAEPPAAETHSHPICGDAHTNIGDHTGECGDITWTAWDGTDKDGATNDIQLTAGSWYLTDNVTLTETLIISSGTVNLCLNGYSITRSEWYPTIRIKDGATLNLCDCNGSGQNNGSVINDYDDCISNDGALTVYGGTVEGPSWGITNIGTLTVYGGSVASTGERGIENYGILTVYGGTVSGNTYGIHNGGGTVNVTGGTVTATRSNDGYGIYNRSNGTVTVSGGTVTATGSNGFGIYNHSDGAYDVGTTTNVSGTANVSGSFLGIYNSGTLTVSGGTVTATGSNGFGIYNYYHGAGSLELSGAPTITGATAGVYLDGGSITLGGALTYVEENAISVGMETPGTFTTGWTTNMGSAADNYVSYFTSADSSYTVQPDGSGELKLAEPPAHSHDMSVDCGNEAPVTFNAWDGTTAFPGGNVYLTNDVTLTETLTISSGTVNLCLNGHSITSSSGAAIKVSSGATLNICDCKSGGSISATGSGNDGITNSGTATLYGGTVSGSNYGIYNSSSGTVNVFGGIVKDTHSSSYGIVNLGTVNVSGGTVNGSSRGIENMNSGGNAKVNVTGGTVTGSRYGIYNSYGCSVTVSGGTVKSIGTDGNNYGIYNYKGSLELSGVPTITGNTAGIYLADNQIITISGALTYTEENAISVKMKNPGTFTTGWTEKMGENADYDSYFTSADSNYIVQKNSGGELELAVKPTTYTVTYLPGINGTGTQTTDTKTQGVVLTVSGAIFTRTGYTQTGWATTDGGNQAYALGASYTADAPITLYPVWTANTNTAYTVEHWQQNVERTGYVKVDTDEKTGTTGAETEAAAKTYTGFTAQSFDQVAIAADGGAVVKIYYNRNTYTVTYTDNGVFLPNVAIEDVVYGAKAPTYHGTTTRPGYTFGGWYKDSGLTTAWDFENDTITGPTTIYAKWTEKANVSIDEDAQTYTWDGNPKSFAITGTPNTGFAVQYKVNGNWTTAAPSAVGAYDVKITRAEDDTYKTYEKEITGGLVIRAATPTADAPTAKTGLVYDGNAKSLINAGTSEHGYWEYSLDGTSYSSDIPTGTDAKTYTVYCRFVPNTGYGNISPVQLSVTIAPLAVDEPTVSGSYTYTGSEQTVELDGFNSSYMTITGGNKGTNADDYEVSITLDSNHTWKNGADGKIEWRIEKAQAEITVDTTPINVIYGDTVTLPGATTNFGTVNCNKSDADFVNADVGSYTVTYTVEDTVNYYGDEKSITVNISALAVEEPTVSGTYTYTGSEQTVVLNGFDDSYMTVSGNKGTNADDYEAIITLDSNYTWKNGADGRIEWRIEKADPTVTWPAATAYVNDASVTLTGGSAAGVGTETSVAGSFALETVDLATAGTKTIKITFTPNSTNYKSVEKTDYTVTVSKRTVESVAEQTSITNAVYGTEQDALGLPASVEITVSGNKMFTVPVTWSGYDATNLNAQTLTGTLDLSAIAGEVENTSSVTASIVVDLQEKDAATFNYENKTETYNGSPISHEISGELEGVASITYSYVGTDGPEYAASATAPANAGTYEVTATFTMEAGYASVAPKTATLTIEAKEIGLDWYELTSAELVYSGTSKVLTATATNLVDGDSCTVTVELVGDNINVGTFSYEATALSNQNYKLPVDVSSPEYTITPKTLTITADSHEVYVGSRQPELTYTIDGLVGTDTLTTAPTLSTDANMYRAGTYAITFASEAAAGNNYSITYVNGTLTVKNYPYIPQPTYDVEIADDITGGEVSASKKIAYKGDTITITVDPDAGYELTALTVTDSRGNAVAVTKISDSKYTFKMPGFDVEIDAKFAKIDTTCPGDSTCPMYPYTDLDTGLWYHDGIHYCIEHGLMVGTGTNIFEPNIATSRAMIVTILWRLEGCPIVNYAMDFEDVAADQWYTEAIRWAASEKIVEGYGNGQFGTNDAITREQMVTIMFRYAKYKGYDVSVGENTNILSYDDAFDVAEWAIPAMQWACGSGMIQGIADGNQMNLAPQGNATRAQAAAILQRFCENVAKEK